MYVPKNYFVVAAATLEDLNREVSSKLNNGWQISGSISVCASVPNIHAVPIQVSKLMYHQPMVK